jgi:hypothetical protein
MQRHSPHHDDPLCLRQHPQRAAPLAHIGGFSYPLCFESLMSLYRIVIGSSDTDGEVEAPPCRIPDNDSPLANLFQDADEVKQDSASNLNAEVHCLNQDGDAEGME